MYRTLYLLVFITITSSNALAQKLFTKTKPGENALLEAQKVVSNIDYYTMDIRSFKKKANTQSGFEIDIPMDKGSKSIHFEKTNILTPDYRLYTSSGKELETSRNYAFYYGTVVGQSSSKATMIYYDDLVSISIFDDDGTYEINKTGDLYAGYYSKDRLDAQRQGWECHVDGLNETKGMVSDSRSILDSECITVFFEIDYDMYGKKGFDLAATEAWFLTLFLQVSIFYIEHDVPLNIGGLQVWDTLDPYASALNTTNLLNLFRNTVHDNPNFNGRLAHLVSGRFLGGGLAHLNSLCSTSHNVSVSTSLNGIGLPYPTYSWDVMVVAHEIGHNIGSPHTQACAWNGNDTAIDGCGNIEGNCPNPGDPPVEEGGTLMSYCHLTPSGINFANGFGPQPGALISDKFQTAPCVTGDNCAKVTPFNDVCDRAKQMPVLNYCVKGFFHNYETTPSGDGGTMSCGDSGVEKDIWYRFDVPDVNTVHLEVQATQTISDLVVEIYSGSCDNLTSVDCGFSINGEAVSFAFNGPVLNHDVLYVRVVEKGSDEEGMFSFCLYSTELPCQDKVDTLLNIYQDLVGAGWIDNSGWEDGALNDACDMCNWYGIKCDYLGRIVEIDLASNNLQGHLPQDLIAFKQLTHLRFNNNQISDTIPDYWNSLEYLLYLDLHDNLLTGSIPPSFATIARANTIHIDSNNIQGPIIEGLGFNGSIQTFTASHNNLTGCFPFGSSGFCGKDSVNLENNPGLPYGGDIAPLCDFGWGTDWDLDGYCFEAEDCNDYDAQINPGVPEILCDAIDNNCDGSIDEGSDFGPNVWIGPDTLGLFQKASNWSLNHVPLICENVEIGTDNSTVHLVVNTDGTTNQLKIRDLSLGPNATLNVPTNVSLFIVGNGVVHNDGECNIAGSINIQDQRNTDNTGFFNNGLLHIPIGGSLNINETGAIGLHNAANGIIDLLGNSYMASTNLDTVENIIYNEGVFNIHGFQVVQGYITDEDIRNDNGGIIEVKKGGYLIVY